MVTDNEFKALIPPLTSEEYMELEKSILAEGCRDALVLWGETIIDGHNRAEICERRSIPYRTVQAELSSREEAKAWILRNQLARRNLTDIDRARVALKYKSLIAEQAKARQQASGGARGNQYTSVKSNAIPEISVDKPLSSQADRIESNVLAVPPTLAEAPGKETRDIVAEMAGLSHGTLRKIEIVDSAAPKPVIKAMEDNVISINKAYELTKAAIDRPELKERLESASPAYVPQITAEDLLREKERLDKEFKRQSQIINYWSIMNSLAYSDYDYQVWLSDLTEEGIENQLRTVDTGVEKAKEIQERLHEICNERRKLRLIK